VFQLINQTIFAGQQIILVPLFLRAWGIETYAGWNVLYAVAAFVTTMNLGLEYYFSAAFIRHAARREYDALNRQLRVALCCAVVVASVLLALLVLGLAAIDIRSTFNIASMDGRTVTAVLFLLAFPAYVLLPEQVLHGIYRAHGDLNRGEAVFALYSLAQLAAIVSMLVLRQSPSMVALCFFAAPFLFAGALIADLRSRYPHLRIGFSLPSAAELKRIVPQCSLYFLDPISFSLVLHGPLLVFGVFNASSAAIVSYTAYRTFTGLARQTANQFGVGGGIEMAQQLARGETAACRALYHYTGRVIAGLLGFVAGICLPAGGAFVSLWTRGAVGTNELLILWFIGGAFLAAPGQAALMVLRYTNRARACAVAWGGHSVGGLALAIALVPSFGVTGAAAAFAISEALAIGLVLPVLVQNSLGFSAWRHWLESYAFGSGAFALSYAVATAVVAEPVGFLDLAVRSALWGVIMLGPVLMLVLRLRWREMIWPRKGRPSPAFPPA
jgi:O-antigen/teichoic acid export membrane protein